MKIIGCGFGRTGSLSMKIALEQLGFGPCHHMHEVIANPDKHLPYWLAASKGEKIDWDEALAGYESCVDWPTAAYWPALAEHFPDAKILLTTRTAESWYSSISKTIFKVISDGVNEAPSDKPNPFGEMLVRMIMKNTFKGNIADRSHCINIFNQNVKSVREGFKGDKLFVYNNGDGWEGLCQWLDVLIPDTPFPRTNNEQEFGNVEFVRPE
ncbi:Sulfotransferase family protein [Candidatus Nitrotoga sp. BS]|uniref:sulfotransferase family protein n=1 Tax=Candidatus Nitrotoga sp. BS TaxID=2890408 RepID=UPI001EF27F3E|nr:sulfotransferase family protein [Candidatus Nitrotoga sp. BS]CAH1210592.1 Sulfotransferase family protein [Candidatus Nitrotoga sp. BS]